MNLNAFYHSIILPDLQQQYQLRGTRTEIIERDYIYNMPFNGKDSAVKPHVVSYPYSDDVFG